jgi:hypothetical protein
MTMLFWTPCYVLGGNGSAWERPDALAGRDMKGKSIIFLIFKPVMDEIYDRYLAASHPIIPFPNHLMYQKRLIKSMRRCCLLAAIAVASPRNKASASSPAFITQKSSLQTISPHIAHKHKNLPLLHLSNEYDQNNLRKDGPKSESTSRNEFSRTIRVSKWFTSLGGGSASSNNKSKNKSLNLSISATDSERNALATRFRLADISSLQAELVVSPALGIANSMGADDSCIEVRGKVSTKVKQTCVRTNEDFDVDLEFNFDNTFKAVAASIQSSGGSSSTLSSGELEAFEAASQLSDWSNRGNKRNKKQTTVKTVKGSQQRGNQLDVKELQKVLTEYEVTNDIIEDESCFCTDGIVDVGEIVSQVFRSKLDPYPKKPGSDPVRYTFTYEDEAWN